MSRRLLRLYVVARRHGLHGPILRRRLAIGGGAVLIGLMALLFARVADLAMDGFRRLDQLAWWVPLIATPAGFALLVWMTRTLAPEARGSGIPQVIAAARDPGRAADALVSPRTALVKFALTPLALLVGASTGREGPTVQIAAAIMALTHRIANIPLRASVMIAGGAAGVSAAFNTPLAGVAFAIEELAAAYEQRMTLLVMAAVLIAGMVSLGLAGDYVYFGAMPFTLRLGQALMVSPVTGVIGGIAGACFARAMLAVSGSAHPIITRWRGRPILLAIGCGIVVAAVGVASGLTWGTGYAPGRALIEGHGVPLWFGPAKFVTTLATSAAGLPGGIFAPSLATGAGVGNLLRGAFPDAPAGAVVLCGMVAYFTGVVRAPLTAVIIVVETTASRGLMLPLLASALIADGAAQLVCRERLYHGLARGFERRP